MGVNRRHQTKLQLAYALNQELDKRNLTQTGAAKLLGLNQPKVSALRHNKLGGFSVARLMKLLMVLGYDIEIRIKPRRRGR